MSESDLLWLFIQSVPREIPGAHAERRAILRGARIGDGDARISIGIEGQADSFVVLPGALHVECETKSAKAGHDPDKGCKCKTCEAQRRWRANCQRLGIPYLILRGIKGEDSPTTVARWIETLKVELPRADRR
jgi:hypothetical protein